VTVPYRLGIDIGTNSLGWCVLDLDRQGRPKAIRRMGVRIFSDGRDPQNGTSLAVDRRMARGARKRRDRFVDRRADLLRALVRHGLMPVDISERKALESLDPYELRWRGLNEKLHPHHLGRAIFHLNQRRGFKSNRKTDKKQKEGDLKGMKGGIGKLREAIDASGANTLGAYLYVAFRKGRTVRGARDGSVELHLTVRARPHVVKGKNEYDLYADRAMYEQEFDLIWQRQIELGAALSDAARKEIRDIVFFQRPLKPVDPGRCALDPTDQRAPEALPLFQRFRMLSELANLEIIALDRSHRPLTLNERDRILPQLERKNELSFDRMRALLGLDSTFTFNLESEKRKGLKGDQTAIALAKKSCFGAAWWSLSFDRRNEIAATLFDEASEALLVARARNDWGLDEEAAQAVADANLPAGYGRIGRKALAKIVPIMGAKVIRYHAAAAEAGYDHARQPDGEVFDLLPYYGEALEHAVGFGSGDPNDPLEMRFGRIANPTVHIALNELRRVTNALAKRYGSPAEIVVELARDLPLGKEAKEEKNREQAENQRQNERRRAELAGLGLPDSGENILRLRLWEELGPVHERRCVYTGEQISIERLFGPDVEIEHILPFTRTLDNSAANRTVSLRKANRYKGNRSPFEAFGAGADGFDWQAMLSRSLGMPKNKRWRFGADAMERFEGERNFLDRQLTDTQYIARVTREYLTKLSGPHNVWVVTGRLTQMLRGRWGLNRLLSDHNLKNRYDHRHHAIDAFVVGVTDRSMLQRVASAADQIRDRLIDDMPDPWEGFRDDLQARLEKLVVSHKPDHGTGGKLHEETAYGLIRDPSKEDGATLVYRKPLSALNANEIERIRDKALRARVQKAAEPANGNKTELAKALAAFSAETGIRHVRLTKVEQGTVSISDRNGRLYKAYSPGENLFVEVLALANGRWSGRGVSLFDANQKSRDGAPEGRAVMRVYKGDLLKLEDSGVDKVVQVHRLDAQAQRFKLAPHNESGNLDKRHADLDDPFRWLMIGYNQLKARKARKVTVDFLGRVNDPGPPQ
jgi:CRISPR-associated endonuclease Csn1